MITDKTCLICMVWEKQIGKIYPKTEIANKFPLSRIEMNDLVYYSKHKIKKTNIYIDSLSQYEEILLIGSGKGVSTVKSIKEKNWNRKNYKSYENFMKKYKSKIMQQKILSNYL